MGIMKSNTERRYATARSVISPNTLEVIWEWVPTTPDEISAGLAKLAKALRQLQLDAEYRRALLSQFRAALLRRRKALVDAIVAEVGKLHQEAEDEMDYALAFIDHAIVHACFTDPPQTQPDRLLAEVPVGIVHLICPYNDPVAGLTRKIAPAIASGCPAIVQPSPKAMFCSEIMKAAWHEADPAGCLFWLLCDDPALAEMALQHEDVALVSFTGSTRSGRVIASTAGKHCVRCVLELGGNNWFTVFSDADIPGAVKDLVTRKTRAAGQACSSVNRVAVEQAIYPLFLEHLTAAIAAVRTGPSSDLMSSMGPVRSLEDVGRLERLINDAVGNGERIVGTPSSSIVTGRDSSWIEPVIIETPEQAPSVLDGQEAFGPILSIRPFNDRTEHLATLRRNSQPLVAYLYGSDIDWLSGIAPTLRHGSVGINSCGIQGPDVPTGGFRLAGVGREGGTHGMAEFRTTVNMRILAASG
jgi:succinate-semialdehyde dehydrogenase/glutarate-semialdehyde dehydrogenase